MKRKYSDTSNPNFNVLLTAAEWDVIDFLAFESETATVYPFAIEFDKITLDTIDQIVNACGENTWDTEIVYEECESVLGINPILLTM